MLDERDQDGYEWCWRYVRGPRRSLSGVGGILEPQEGLEGCWWYIRGHTEGLIGCFRYVRGPQE